MGEHTPGELRIDETGEALGRIAEAWKSGDAAVKRALAVNNKRYYDAGYEAGIAGKSALLEACYFMRDFYHMDTKEFVEKWGHGHTTKSVGDKARAAITAARPEAAAEGGEG